MASYRQFFGLALLVATAFTAQAAFETWNKRDIRVFAEGKTANGEIVPIADCEAMIWLDKPELQDKLDEALRRYENKDSYSPNPYRQMTWIVMALGDPDIRRTTDMNGNAFFDGAKLDQKCLAIVVNIAPEAEAGGVYAGVKRPMELRAVCLPVNQRGLAKSIATLRYGFHSPPLTPHQKEFQP
ncbi:MAG: hypothetical protein AAGK14_10270 [Verrucomicrobiota bacterium]